MFFAFTGGMYANTSDLSDEISKAPKTEQVTNTINAIADVSVMVNVEIENAPMTCTATQSHNGTTVTITAPTCAQ